MKQYSIIGQGLIGKFLANSINGSRIYTRDNLDQFSQDTHDVVIIAAPTGNRLVVNTDPEVDIKDYQQIIDIISCAQYKTFIYISTIDVYRDHNYGNNRRYLENALSQLPGSHIIRLPSLIDVSLNKNILYDLKNRIWLDKVSLDSEVQWYPLKRLSADIDRVVEQDVKYQNLFSPPVCNQDIVTRFFPELIEQLKTNQLVAIKYDFQPYAISTEEIWQSFEEFFIDFLK